LEITNARTPLPAALVVEDVGTAFMAKDGGGQKLAYFHYEEEPGQAVDGEDAHTAKLPELLTKP